jgi:hypothetical protein
VSRISAASGLAYWQNDVPAVRAAYQEGLAIYEELDDRPGVAEGGTTWLSPSGWRGTEQKG